MIKKEYMKEYREKNKERIKNQTQKYREKNKERIKNQRKDYNQRNKEKMKEYRQEYSKRSETIKRVKKYYQRPEVVKRLKKYYQKPEVKDKRKKYSEKYNQKPEAKIKKKKYSEEYKKKNKKKLKQKRKEYNLRPEVKKRVKEYYSNPEIKSKRKKQTTEYREKNKERLKQKQKEYYEKNKKIMNAKAREYHKKHYKEYYEKNKERINKRKVKYRKRVDVKQNMKIYRKEYRKRLSFVIVKCKICGDEIKTKEYCIGANKSKIKGYCRICSLDKLRHSKDTVIEKKMKQFLKTLKIKYTPNLNIKRLFPNAKIKYYIMDFYLPELKISVECDGDYIHCNPDTKSNKGKYWKPNDINEKTKQTAKETWAYDNKKKKDIEKLGIKVIRLWGSEIDKMTLNNFKKILIENGVLK